ncbi:MAG: hypothetical protein AVDCRST_MAG78-2650 [uncultured Rubrobacteraceae bacterium]|uniref:Uncharacterized protein n=1 Tax=uncultured Rubrobacteraceae bacterium TaxID=349277 RepID=A0A6J4QPF7_9ACTN|nr:MAG: hypothetical protein AVDCRST_MAG78-2650 [uncultured Rubrobacteraceae bacterium]
MLVEQCRGLPGRRDLPYPIGNLPLPVTELECGIAGLPCPSGGQYRQVVVFTDHQVLREAAVESPAGVCEGLLYLFFGRSSNSFNMRKRIMDPEPWSLGKMALKV